MNFFKNLSSINLIVLFVGLLLIIYGITSRALSIYFFWESLTLGWFIILIGLILVFKEGIKSSHRNGLLGKRIGIGVLSFTVFIYTLLILIIPNSRAYEVATEYLKTNTEIHQEIGDIYSFGADPMGSISMTTDKHGEKGNAELNILIKGEKMYKVVKVVVVKEYNSDWEVIEIN